MTKQQLARSRVFYETIDREIKKANIQETKPVGHLSGPTEYTIETTVGAYTFHTPTSEPTPFMTVFGRFADPLRAKAKYDCNPHNGKWNFHTTAHNVKDAERNAMYVMQRIMTA